LLILNATVKLFHKFGYETEYLRTTAKASGMKSGVLYYHFTSKEIIVIEVLTPRIKMAHRELELAIHIMSFGFSASKVERSSINSNL
jgi:AcrR family transcriptional regulator